jgi:hypothetical protein
VALPADGQSVYIRFVLCRSGLACAASTLLWSMAALSCAQVAGLEEVTLTPGAGGAAGGQTQTTASGGGSANGGGGAGGCTTDYVAEVMADTPLAYWRLGESIAAVASDEMGKSDGSYLAAPAVDVPGALACGDDGAAQLDGATQYIDFGDVFEFSGNAPFSVELWLRPELLDGEARYVIAHRTDSDPDTVGWGMFVDDNSIDFRRWFTGNGLRDLVDAPIGMVATDRYTHVVATYDGANLRLYLDGLLVDDELSTTAIDATSSVLLAGRPYAVATGGYYGGFIDEIAIYGTALPAPRVLAHHQAGTGN